MNTLSDLFNGLKIARLKITLERYKWPSTSNNFRTVKAGKKIEIDTSFAIKTNKKYMLKAGLQNYFLWNGKVKP